MNESLDKKATIESLNKTNYTKGEVINIVSRISIKTKVPNKFKKGDVYLSEFAYKTRPCVIIKVCDDYVLSIPISSTEDCINLCKGNSRFYGDNHFAKTLLSAKIETVVKNFVGTYDNNKAVNNAIREIKKLMLDL